MVGAIVITIVATAGMASTTYVQFLKGAMLIVFSFVLVIAICVRGFNVKPDQGGRVPFHHYATLVAEETGGKLIVAEPGYSVLEVQEVKAAKSSFAKLAKDGQENWWYVSHTDKGVALKETECTVTPKDGPKLINGLPASPQNQLRQVGNIEQFRGAAEAPAGSVSPTGFLAALTDKDTIVRRWKDAAFTDKDGAKVQVFYPVSTPGNLLMRPGQKFKVQGTPLEKFDFVSLMLALFLGTAALPHILIRYYTVPNPASARKSTIVAIAAIGFFYILTLFMGLGAMVSSVINPADSNMAAPLLARSFGDLLFAVISAIAFATVLGTVSGLIVAASGAVAHDLMDRFLNLKMDDRQKIKAGKISAFVVGAMAIVLGILFKGMNVTFLVGLAFAVAASGQSAGHSDAAVLEEDHRQRDHRQHLHGRGQLAGPDRILRRTFTSSMGWTPRPPPSRSAIPGIVSIPLSFITLVLVSLMTPKKGSRNDAWGDSAVPITQGDRDRLPERPGGCLRNKRSLSPCPGG